MKVAMLGLGSAGSRHALNALELGHEVLGFDPEAGDVPGVGRVESIGEAVSWADAVVVASPSSLHAGQAVEALAARKPTLVEKPLAVSVEDAERVVDAARGTVSGVAMNLRFHRGILGLRDLLPELGPIRLATASFGYDLRLWRPGTDYRASYSAQAALGGGILLDAIHELDYLLWLLGPVASVSAELERISELEIDVEDTALLALRFGSGALGSVDLNCVEPAYRRGCVLVGSEAVASWDWSAGAIVVRREDEERSIDAACDVKDTYKDVLEDFLEAAATGRRPRTPLEDGLAALRVAHAARRSAELGQRVTL
jgi:predicted dehydrogenase